MKKIWNWFLYLVILSGFPILAWAGYSLTIDTYMFWKHGVEKKAEVIALDYTSSSGKGGTTYYYELSIEEDVLVERFRYKLPVDQYVSILALPSNPEKITLGNEDSSLFEIFSYSIGGDIMTGLVLGMFVFMIIFGPSTLVQLIKSRKAFVDQ